MLILFYGLIFLIFYHAIGYYFLLMFLNYLKQHDNINQHREIQEFPLISVIISAYNEEKNIRQRIENILSLKYPLEKLEIIVVNDKSDDRTSEILKQINYERLIIIDNQERKGKTGSLNEAVKYAHGEFLLFTDANTIFNENVITELLSYFTNSKIGGVRGRLIVLNKEEFDNLSNAETDYWNFELKLVELEANYLTTISFPGSIYLIKKELFSPIPIDRTLMDDFYEALKILERGYFIKYAKNALAYEYNSSDPWGEYKRKIRIATANFNILKEVMKSLLFRKYSLIAKLFLFSHKVLRWLFPFAYALLFLISIFLIRSNLIARLIFLAIVFQLGFAFLGYVYEFTGVNFKWKKFFRLNLYFFLLLVANFQGFIKSIQKTKPFWDRVERQE